MADWTKIKTEYITTQTSYRALEQKYGINYRVIADRGKKEGWSQLRSQHQDRTLTRAVNKICEKKADRAAHLSDVAEKLLEKVEALLETDCDLPLDTQAMKHISGVLKDIKDIQMVKSEADLREQEARIAKLRKEAEREDNGPNKVVIQIEGGEDAWSK